MKHGSRARRLIGSYCREKLARSTLVLPFCCKFYSLEYRELWQRTAYVLHNMARIKDKHLGKKRRTVSAYVYTSRRLPILNRSFVTLECSSCREREQM